MITHEITRYTAPMRLSKKGKPHFVTGTEDHRRYILARTIEAVYKSPNFDQGRLYKIKGRSSAGQLLHVLDQYKDVKWNGLMVKCMEVYIPEEQSSDLFHPSELSLIKGH